MNKWRQLLVGWDTQQEMYRPDRERGLRAMCELVASAHPGGTPRVLDLACGCGSVTSRLLDALPSAYVLGIDRDPVLLRIAREIWADDPRVGLERADLREEGWRLRHGGAPFDAVVTAASLHWFEPQDLSLLYHAIARSIRPGGLFVNLDWIPIARAPDLQSLSDASIRDRDPQVLAERDGCLSPWRTWWAHVLADPELAAEVAERSALELPRSAEFFADEDWHRSELTAAGFSEVGVIWRSFSSAVIVSKMRDAPADGSHPTPPIR